MQQIWKYSNILHSLTKKVWKKASISPGMAKMALIFMVKLQEFVYKNTKILYNNNNWSFAFLCLVPKNNYQKQRREKMGKEMIATRWLRSCQIRQFPSAGNTV